MLLEATTVNNSVETSARRRRGEGKDRIEECLVGILRIGVVCSMESPAERMEMTDVVAKLRAVRENFLGTLCSVRRQHLQCLIEEGK
ncbi:hypothetical protein EZV62_025851 [Acer yangbiense]|uniref:Serine-threonine/tyrosine-protein kinase catalytic domain-containing protein n=1 Tax=Acer yangbiense TaxID=1000413 RepID=A0A5C7H116_9ROSI|nr:hypothetical protein EZV62_025851 [Acer yangbiense]